MFDDRIPMSPSELPQQRIYEVVSLPEKPTGFDASCLIWDDDRNKQWSLRDDQLQQRMPGTARFIAQAEWAWGPCNNRINAYYLSSNTKKTHWFLWLRFVDESTGGFENILGAYCTRCSNDPHLIAIHLLKHHWQSERREGGIDHPHWINHNKLLSIAELMAIARNVW